MLKRFKPRRYFVTIYFGDDKIESRYGSIQQSGPEPDVAIMRAIEALRKELHRDDPEPKLEDVNRRLLE
jgi:hypothetical protein